MSIPGISFPRYEKAEEGGNLAVNGAFLYGNNSALNLIASGNVWGLFSLLT